MAVWLQWYIMKKQFLQLNYLSNNIWRIGLLQLTRVFLCSIFKVQCNKGGLWPRDIMFSGKIGFSSINTPICKTTTVSGGVMSPVVFAN